VDAKFNIITDTHITAGNISYSEPCWERLMAQMPKFNFPVETVALDSGYFTDHICKKLHEEKIFMVMGYRRLGNQKNVLPKRKFHYVKELDVFSCPMGCRVQQPTERDIVIINLTKRTVQSVNFGTNVGLQKINKERSLNIFGNHIKILQERINERKQAKSFTRQENLPLKGALRLPRSYTGFDMPGCEG
jgi:hypothetical protein